MRSQWISIQPACRPTPRPVTRDPTINQRIMHLESTPSQLNLPRPSATTLVIALGDPAGIGAEVTLKALALPRPPEQRVELVGCRRWLEETYMLLRDRSAEPLADPAEFTLIDLPLQRSVRPGLSDAAAGAASFDWLTQAVRRVQARGRALITAPIAKASWHAAGFTYPGQTERLAELAGVAEASMLFTARSPHGGWRFNTLLATTHIPLAAVPSRLSAALVERKLGALLEFCQRFQPKPHLVVAGLNPHAGEAGNLGVEERDWLEPALAAWRQRHSQATLAGPLPPDSCWLEAAQAWQGRATPKPAMAKPVPWSGEVRRKGSPRLVFTAASKASNLTGISP